MYRGVTNTHERVARPPGAVGLGQQISRSMIPRRSDETAGKVGRREQVNEGG